MELHFGIVPKFHNSRGMFPRDEIKKTVHSQGLFSGNVPAPGMKSKYRSFTGNIPGKCSRAGNENTVHSQGTFPVNFQSEIPTPL